MEKGKTMDVVLRVRRPEGYEDVHPDIVVSDMNIHPGFSCEVIELTDEEKRRVEEARTYAKSAAQDHAQFLLSLLERSGVIE